MSEKEVLLDILQRLDFAKRNLDSASNQLEEVLTDALSKLQLRKIHYTQLEAYEAVLNVAKIRLANVVIKGF